MIPALRRDRRDRVHPVMHQPPEARRVVAAAGRPAAEADDRDRLPRGAARLAASRASASSSARKARLSGDSVSGAIARTLSCSAEMSDARGAPDNNASISASVMAATAAAPNRARRFARVWRLSDPHRSPLPNAASSGRRRLQKIDGQPLDRGVVEHQRRRQGGVEAEPRAELAAQLHRHQRIEAEIRQAIMPVRRICGIASEHPDDMVAHEIAQHVQAVRREGRENALAQRAFRFAVGRLRRRRFSGRNCLSALRQRTSGATSPRDARHQEMLAQFSSPENLRGRPELRLSRTRRQQRRYPRRRRQQGLIRAQVVREMLPALRSAPSSCRTRRNGASTSTRNRAPPGARRSPQPAQGGLEVDARMHGIGGNDDVDASGP